MHIWKHHHHYKQFLKSDSASNLPPRSKHTETHKFVQSLTNTTVMMINHPSIPRIPHNLQGINSAIGLLFRVHLFRGTKSRLKPTVQQGTTPMPAANGFMGCEEVVGFDSKTAKISSGCAPNAAVRAKGLPIILSCGSQGKRWMTL